MKANAAKIILYTLVILLSLAAIWVSFSLSMKTNKALYQGF